MICSSSILAIITLTIALPSFISALVNLPGDRVYKRIVYGEVVSGSDIMVLDKARRLGLSWRNSSNGWNHRANGYLRRANLKVDSARMNDLKKAKEFAINSIKRSPSNSYAWSRLMLANYRLEGRTEDVRRALMASINMANYLPRLFYIRAKFGMRIWPLLSQLDRKVVFQQIRMGFKVDKKQIISLTGHPVDLGIIRAAMSIDLKSIIAFEDSYEFYVTRHLKK